MTSLVFPYFGDNCTVDQTTLDVDRLITKCDSATLDWSGWPDVCPESPQGYHVWRTTVPPTNTAVSLCIGIDDKKRLVDGSVYTHALYYYTDKYYGNVLYTSLTPWGVQAARNAIVFNRSVRDYIVVQKTGSFDLGSGDFTIEAWIGRNGESWYYNFPCETIMSCYNGDYKNSRDIWRIFFEPRAVNRSLTTDLTANGGPWLQEGSTAGTLVLEMNGYDADGNNVTITRNIMDTTSNTNPAYSYTGGTLRFGYSHICVTRKENTLDVYVDGVRRLRTGMNFTLRQTTQNVVLGRHYGDSKRLDPAIFEPNYTQGLTANFDFPRDGDQSYFHGSMYDIRIIKGVSVAPPLGGRADNVCGSEVWYETFEKIAGLPPTITNYTDEQMPLDKGVYYRVSAVQCGKDIYCECPFHIKILKQSSESFLGQAVNTQTDLETALLAKPPTLKTVFDTWHRGDAAANRLDAPGSFVNPHRDWYYDSSLGSFVMPTNTSMSCLVAPPERWMKSYTHQAIVQSYDSDNDVIGLVGAWSYYDGQHYMITMERDTGGIYGTTDNWNVVLTTVGMKTVLNTMKVVGSWGHGWSGRTSFVRVDRNGTKLTGSCGPFEPSTSILRSQHTIDPASTFEIDFASTPPPAGLSNWDMFMGRTGYGFNAWSQGGSFYRDWYLYPNPDMRIFDFSNGAPGEVWDWNPVTDKWVKNENTAWEVVGKTASVISDLTTGREYDFSCSGTLTF